MSDARTVARLKLIALLNELPLDADINLGVHFLSREDFDRLPGTNEYQSSKRTWTKDVQDEGVTVDYFTNEPPASVVAYPTRTQANLRVVEAPSEPHCWVVPEGDKRCGHLHAASRSTCLARKGHEGSHRNMQGYWRNDSEPEVQDA